jgi:hypothetical protein
VCTVGVYVAPSQLACVTSDSWLRWSTVMMVMTLLLLLIVIMMVMMLLLLINDDYGLCGWQVGMRPMGVVCQFYHKDREDEEIRFLEYLLEEGNADVNHINKVKTLRVAMVMTMIPG